MFTTLIFDVWIPTYKNGDEGGMVDGIAIPTLPWDVTFSWRFECENRPQMGVQPGETGETACEI